MTPIGTRPSTERRAPQSRAGGPFGTRASLGRYAAALFIASAVLFSTPAGGVLHSAAERRHPAGGMSRRRLAMRDRDHPMPDVCVPHGHGRSHDQRRQRGIRVPLDAGLPSADSARVAFCPVTDPPTIVSGGDPQCAYGLDPDQVIVNPIVVPVTPDGTVGATYPTQIDPSGEDNAPIGASPIISNNDPKPPSSVTMPLTIAESRSKIFPGATRPLRKTLRTQR